MTWALVVSAAWLTLGWVVAILVGRAAKARERQVPRSNARATVEGEALRSLLRPR